MINASRILRLSFVLIFSLIFFSQDMDGSSNRKIMKISTSSEAKKTNDINFQVKTPQVRMRGARPIFWFGFLVGPARTSQHQITTSGSGQAEEEIDRLQHTNIMHTHGLKAYDITTTRETKGASLFPTIKRLSFA